MSSPLSVSAFYEVDVLQSQNRRNLKVMSQVVDQKAIGTPITGAIRNRNILERSISEPADRNANNQHSQLSLAQSQQQQQSQRQNVNSSRYKTELCRPFEENGYCKYGDKCQFAHGHHEVRSLARHPKYKTELCRTFHTIGFCPYGPRCHFIHNEDERKLSQIDHMKSPEPQQQAPSAHGRVSPPHQAQRPSRFQLSLPLVRDSLGSTADSPPSSVSDSPTMSPTFVGENDILGSSLPSLSQAFTGRSAPMSAPPTSHHHRAFQFPQDLTSMMTPLNIHTDPIASLSASLQSAVTLSAARQQHQNQRNNDNNNLNFLKSYHEQHYLISTLQGNSSPLSDQEFYAPPSPPDSLSGDSISSTGSASSSSLCGSPLDASRGFRLPIFTSLSME